MDRDHRSGTSGPTLSSRTIRLLALLLLASLAFATGCVRRRLTIRSDPPGAVVYVDRQPIGTTPVSTSFTYYGVRTIEVVKDRYQTQTLKRRFFPAWYEIPPLDFISENLWPHELRDERVVEVQMVPQEVVNPDQLRSRAEALRASSRQGQIVPLAPGAYPSCAPATQGSAMPTP